MRRWTAIVLFVIQVLFLSGCKGEEEAREYAKGLTEVLKVYQRELETKAGAEKKAYMDLATIYVQAADSDLLASLRTERNERGDRVADQLLEGKILSNSALKDALKEYASLDTEMTRNLLFRESENYDKYLSTLNKLSVDSAQIEVLINALEALTKKTSVLEQIEFLKDYGQSARDCLDEMLCNDLATNLNDVNKALAEAGEGKEKEALQAKVAGIEGRQKAAHCDKNPTCPKQDTGASGAGVQ